MIRFAHTAAVAVAATVLAASAASANPFNISPRAQQQAQPWQPSYAATAPAYRDARRDAYAMQYAPEAAPRYAPRYAPQYATREAMPQPSRATTREVVAYNGTHAPGTVVVNTTERRLYLVLGNGRALRYAIGVGREGFQWSGRETITNMQEWPDWTPPAEMIARQPYLPRYMAGGPGNPLGARALYLGGTLYRIHGSNEPDSIGQAVSSGCIRMLNEDVVDLYQRVRIGTPVVVLR